MAGDRTSMRRTVLIVVVVVAIASTASAYVISRSGTDDSAGVPAQTAWQRVMNGTTDTGETTVTMARQAFSLTFERLPGVAVPKGSRDDIQSGSAALRMMIAHWAELTVREQNTVLSYLPTDDTGAASTTTGVPVTEGAAGRVDTDGVQMVSFVRPTGAGPTGIQPSAAAGGPDDATKQLIAGRAEALRVAIGALAGKFLIGEVSLSYNSREIEKGSAAYTLPHAAGQLVTHPTADSATLSGVTGPYAGCYVAFNPDGWNSKGTDLDFVIAHELYHCFEGMFVGDLDIFYDPTTAPPWVVEGGANWAAAQVVPTSHRASGAWQDYLLQPSTPLFQQSYDAIGFWNHLEEKSAVNTWAALRNALGKPSAEALAQTDAASDPFLDSWASSLFRQPRFGINWQTDGPTMSGLRYTPEEVEIANGARASRTAQPHAKALLYSNIAADIVVIVGVGHVSLHNAAHDEAQFGQLVYCARENGCECPPGSANSAPSPMALDGRAVALGVTGSDKAAAVALGGISLHEWCKKTNPPISKRPSRGNAQGGANPGDGNGSLCQQIVDREGIDGLLNNPSMSPQDIRDCVAEILANNGFPGS